MNKFLSLILVLGMAAGANAAIQLSINGAPAPDTYTMNVSDVIVIDVMSDNALPYGAWLVLEDKSLGEWASDMTITPAAGPDAYAINWDADYPGWWELSAASFNPDNPVVPGVHFLIDFHCLGAGDVDITLRAYDESVVDRVTITQVPEPITLALLGVGGLFLRRRK